MKELNKAEEIYKGLNGSTLMDDYSEEIKDLTSIKEIKKQLGYLLDYEIQELEDTYNYVEMEEKQEVRKYIDAYIQIINILEVKGE